MTFLQIVLVKTYFDKICYFLIFIITSQNNCLLLGLLLPPQEIKKNVDNVHNLVYKSLLTISKAFYMWITIVFFLCLFRHIFLSFSSFVQFAQTQKNNSTLLPYIIF